MYDDKFNIKPNIKLILSVIFLITIIYFDNDILLKYIIAPPHNTIYPLLNLSFPVTILCFLLFINALNMFDGINLQCGVYVSIVFIIFIIEGIFPIFSLAMLISLIFFLILNFNGKIFLGDNGVLCLGFILSYIFIHDHNTYFHFSIEEIFLLMYLPGLDLCRVAFFRAINKKHPFSPDRSHIHHYFTTRFSDFYSHLLITLLAFVPYALNLWLDIPYIIIISSIIIYSCIIFYFKRHISSN
tara:strand:+ start:623 stop:1348 length:726 start_codon:yes stop_codon:yes gene_type:complete